MRVRLPQRRPLRLQGYDYARPGSYFVTIVTNGREELFGEVRDGVMVLSPEGQLVSAVWAGLPRHYRSISLDAWIVMPNHVHGIVVIKPDSDRSARETVVPAASSISQPADTRSVRADDGPDQGRGRDVAPARRISLSEVVRGFKTFSARQVNAARDSPQTPVWQRSYYERIIRDGRELQAVRRYIAANPGHWADDEENPRGRFTRPEGLAPM